ncbi:MAG: MBOAT family protein [Planctomycetota bacterium]|jgi:alginate O-acetyltransferase complex protein AlgI
MPGWALMWTFCLGVVAALKATVAHAYGAAHPAWAWGWPGMDPERFHRAPAKTPAAAEILGALARITVGATLVWGVVPRLGPGYAAAWIGLVGFGLIVLFGLLHLLSIHWRARGFDAQPLFDRILTSRSLGEFWGRRWNRAFADAAQRLVYRPLARRLGPRAAVAAVFAASGLGHDLLLSVPAGGGYGLCTLYFALQGAGVFVERRRRRRWFTALVVLAPLPLLFHPLFMRAVFLPFLAALGALGAI